MVVLRWLGASVLLFSGCAPLRFPSQGEPWTEVTTPHFVVTTDVGPSESREIAADLEHRYAEVDAVFPGPLHGLPRARALVLRNSHRELGLHFSYGGGVTAGEPPGENAFDVLQLHSGITPGLGAPREQSRLFFLDRAAIYGFLAYRELSFRFDRMPYWARSGLVIYCSSIFPTQEGLALGLSLPEWRYDALSSVYTRRRWAYRNIGWVIDWNRWREEEVPPPSTFEALERRLNALDVEDALRLKGASALYTYMLMGDPSYWALMMKVLEGAEDFYERFAEVTLGTSPSEWDRRFAGFRARDLRARTVPTPTPGGSTWQSLARRLPSSEVRYFNGDIADLGASLGVRTPHNRALMDLAPGFERGERAPRSLSIAEFRARAQAVEYGP